MAINVPRYLHLNLSKHVMHNIRRFRLRAHTLKLEAAAWLEGGFRICDQCPGEDKHVQNKVHAFAFCQDHPVCELKNYSSWSVTPFWRTSQQPRRSICCNRLTTSLFTDGINFFLSRTIHLVSLFLSFWNYLSSVKLLYACLRRWNMFLGLAWFSA